MSREDITIENTPGSEHGSKKPKTARYSDGDIEERMEKTEYMGEQR